MHGHLNVKDVLHLYAEANQNSLSIGQQSVSYWTATSLLPF